MRAHGPHRPAQPQADHQAEVEALSVGSAQGPVPHAVLSGQDVIQHGVWRVRKKPTPLGKDSQWMLTAHETDAGII